MTGRTIARRALPWLVAAALVGYLLYTIPLDEVRAALAAADLPALIAVVLGLTISSLLADTLATSRVLSWFLAPVSFKELLPVRAATYLMAFVNYHLGQAGLVYFVHRARGASIAAVTGVMLMAMGTMLLILTALSICGVVISADDRARQLSPLLACLGGGAALYLLVIGLRPRWLAQRTLLAPLFAAGIVGHLRATGVRVPHVLVVAAGHYLALRCFGVSVPLADGILLIPILLLVASVPVTPFGLGTVQLIAVQLFARFAPGAPDAQEAAVLAYSLSLTTLTLCAQALMGLGSIQKVTHLIVPPDEPASGG